MSTEKLGFEEDSEAIKHAMTPRGGLLFRTFSSKRLLFGSGSEDIYWDSSLDHFENG